MDGAAACLVAVAEAAQRRGARLRVGPPGDGLAFGIGPQVLALEEAQFVLRPEVGGRKPRAALEPDDLHARLGELGRQHAPAAPTPTMTTSVFSVAMALVLCGFNRASAAAIFSP